MNYEYNGNLLEDDRINLVANEIISAYPQINIDQAKQIAMLEGKISTDKNFEIEFNRLYNIITIMKNDKNIVRTIYKDLVNLLVNNKEHEKINYYYEVALNISNFLMDRGDF